MPLSQSLISLRSVDEYLGDAEKRFFGAGFRRVQYRFGEVRIESPGSLETVVAVVHPVDWSKKSTSADLPPHLSTVDALLLTVNMSEMYLTHARRLTEISRARSWVRSVKIKAGANPEENLDNLVFRTSLMQTRADSDSLCGFVSMLHTQVGGMRVRCEIEHERGDLVEASAVYNTPDELLGPAANRYYGDGFKARTHRLVNVQADLRESRATASVELCSATENIGINGGLESVYFPTPTMIDCFVVNLQLAQILLYEMDCIQRTESNTLWMRRTALAIREPQRELRDGGTVTTALIGSELVQMNGGIWRTTDIVGNFGGVHLRCAVAHQLNQRMKT
jgi:Pseudomonas avirulence D protein (AvrD)